MVCSPSTEESQDNIRLGHNIGQMDNSLEKKKIELKELVRMQKIGNDTSIEGSVTSHYHGSKIWITTMVTLSNDGGNAWQREPQKSNKFMLAKQQLHTCSKLFVHFLLSDAFGLLWPRNFATVAMWHNDFSTLLSSHLIKWPRSPFGHIPTRGVFYVTFVKPPSNTWYT